MADFQPYASKGVAGAGLGLGIAGTALGLFSNGGFGGLFGNNNCVAPCSENTPATRYDLDNLRIISSKDAEIAELKSDQKTDGKILELYHYVDKQFNAVGQELAQIAAVQAVTNQKVKDDFVFLKADYTNKICNEQKERKCNDNLIINYANQTFYAKLIAGIEASKETSPQDVYNPIPPCGCDSTC